MGVDSAVVIGGLEYQESMPPVMRDGVRGGRPGRDSRDGGLVGENELLGCVSAQESVGSVLGGDDLGAGDEVEVRLVSLSQMPCRVQTFR